MTPDYALVLSYSGIALLQRALAAGGPARGWYLLGHAPLDHADLASALTELRGPTVQSVDEDGPEVKLVLPNEQIKYVTTSLNGDDAAAEAEAALDGATPYDVTELVYDWRAVDGVLQIAAVARETLQEAEGFALDNNFLPLCYVAQPPDDTFDGEPFFGPTGAALTRLAPGVTVRGDDTAIAVLDGVPPAPKVESVPESEPEPNATRAPAAPPPELVTPVEATASDEDVAPTLSAPVEDPAATRPVTADAPPISQVTFASLRAERASVSSTVTAPSVPDPQAQGVTPKLNAPSAPETHPGPRIKDAPAGVADTLKTQAAESLTAAVPEAAPQQSASDSIPVETNKAPEDVGDRDNQRLTGVLARAQLGLGKGVGFVSRRRGSAKPSQSPAVTPAQSRAATADGTTRQALTRNVKMDEAERLTTFGARRSQSQARIGGKPRFLGLMLTAALMLILLGVAAWASIFVDDGLARFFPDRSDQALTETAAAEDPSMPDVSNTAALQSPQLTLPLSDETASTDDTGEIIASLSPGIAIPEGAPLTEPSPLTVVPVIVSEPMTPEQAQTRYAATGIWQKAPTPPAELRQSILDDLYITSIDRTVQQRDAVALPAALSFDTDALPQPVGLPPRPGETFVFDEHDLIVPTPEGVVTPDGYRLVLGRPDVLPRYRTPLTAPEQPTDNEIVNAPFVVDPSLANKRARVRPEGLIENAERARLGGVSREELAELRPRLRPQNLVVTASTTEEDQADADTTKGVQLQVAAVALPSPRTRPGNMAQIVRRAAPQVEETQTGSAVASVAPRTVSPAAPSPTTVARAATQNNAINLRRVNLIGVYGKPSDRRALVRLSNGRFKKVRVGDRIDGGRILAISDTQLRYQKGGRNLTLAIPQG
ncbi:MAG: hypothetical protein MK098_01925 [Marinovum sp.]|nr:hypothetical protein [Marinovum sp.]